MIKKLKKIDAKIMGDSYGKYKAFKMSGKEYTDLLIAIKIICDKIDEIIDAFLDKDENEGAKP